MTPIQAAGVLNDDCPALKQRSAISPTGFAKSIFFAKPKLNLVNP